jgi:hypothetical protein
LDSLALVVTVIKAMIHRQTLCGRCVLLAAALAPALSACGDLPQPFAGNPGATARRLAQPPPSRLLVLPADNALLPDSGVQGFPVALTAALQDRGVPAVAAYPHKGDWFLVTTADLQGTQVVPRFSVRNPQGLDKGAVPGPPISAEAWSAAAPDTLRQEAAAAAPGISDLLDRIEALREESDPNSLLNRPVQVAVRGVTGAPGDGDTALARQVRSDLEKGGVVMQTTPAGADFVVQCQVRAVPETEGMVRIELQWIVTDAQNREAGRVVQINEVPQAAISGLWGDVAIAAGEEAAGGIRDVIDKQLRAPSNVGPRKPPPPAAS